MFWRIGWILFSVLCASPVCAGHGLQIDLRRATPGLRLELIDLPQTAGQIAKRYRLHASNYPRGVAFAIFKRNFGQPFEEVVSGFRVDGAGNLISNRILKSQRLDEMVFEPGPYPRGAAWELGLVSADRTLLAFARTIPYPITARDGACTVQLELVSPRGSHFVATGAGFAPGDEAIIEAQYFGQSTEKRQRISSEGLLPPSVLAHQATGADRSARYAVKARSCKVVVDYEWGEAALLRRSH
jgi:hypothetical protein